jgi:hypothetical protein
MPSPYYRFDGTNDVVTLDSLAAVLVDTSNIKGSILWRGDIQTRTTGDVLFSFGDTSANEMLMADLSSNSIRVLLRVAGTTQWSFTTDDTYSADTELCLVLVQDGTAPILYINGVLQAITRSDETDNTAWFDVLTGVDNGRIAARSISGAGNAEVLACSVNSFHSWNHALTAAEVKELYSGASVPFKYKGASQTEMITDSDDTDFAGGDIGNWIFDTDSGNGTCAYNAGPGGEKTGKVTVGATPGTINGAKLDTSEITTFQTGKVYRVTIDIYIPSANNNWTSLPINLGSIDDVEISAVDATLATEDAWQQISRTFIITSDVTGSVGVRGESTTTGDIFYFDNISITQIGAVAEYDGSGVASDKWFDKSGNDLHGTVTGASVENAPSGEDDGLVYETGTWTPVCVGAGGSAGSASTTVYGANYTRIGNLVTVTAYFRWDDIGSYSGNASITGLPFTHEADTRSVGVLGPLKKVELPDGHPFTPTIIASTTVIILYRTSSDLAAKTEAQVSHFNDATNEICVNIDYRV